MILFIYILFSVFLGESVQASSDGKQWGYGKTHGEVYGPQDWGKVSSKSKCCGNGTRQSPINIDTSKVQEEDVYNGETVVRYNTLNGILVGKLENNGHAPVFNVKEGIVNYTNPHNKDTFKLEQFHIHFGCKDEVGSEHTIDGKAYSGEIHFVFYNKKYKNFDEAKEKRDGLTVIGVFLKKATWKVPHELRKLGREIAKIAKENSTETVKLSMAKLVSGLGTGYETLDHYSYSGSLTTPDCHESVNWLVVKDPINVNTNVLKALRNLESKVAENGKMCNNFRPTQPLNCRPVKMHD